MNPIYLPQDTPARFLKRNGFLIAGVSVFVMFWVLVYAFTLYSPNYAAKSTVIIKDSAITSRYVMPEQYYALQTTSSSSSNPVLNTMGLLKSQAISDALFAYLLEKHPDELTSRYIGNKAQWEKFFTDGSKFIKAKNQPGTDLIVIEFAWDDPVIAREALQVVVDAFQQASLELNQSEQRSRTTFLEKQVEELELQLAEVRGRKTQYRRNTGTVSVKRESDDLAASRMELGNRLSQIEAQARGKEAEVARYQKMLGMNPEKALKASALGQNATMARLQDELYTLQQKLANLRTTYTENNPKVKEVQSQVDEIKADIEAEKRRTLGSQAGEAVDGVVADTTRGTVVSNMVAAQAEAQRLRSEAAVIRGRLGEVNGLIQRFPEVEAGLMDIEQEEGSLSNALDNLRQKVMEAKVKEEQTLSNVFVVDPPRMPVKPEFPSRLHLVVLSVVLGLGAGTVAAMGKEQLTGEAGDLRMPEWMQPVEGPRYVYAPEPAEPEPEPEENQAAPQAVSGPPEPRVVSGPESAAAVGALVRPDAVFVPAEQAASAHANRRVVSRNPADFNRAFQLYAPSPAEPQPVEEAPAPAHPVEAEIIAPVQADESYINRVPVLHASPAYSLEDRVSESRTLPAALEAEVFGYPPPPVAPWIPPEEEPVPVAVKTHLAPGDDLMEALAPLPSSREENRRSRGVPAFLMDEAPAALDEEDFDFALDPEPLPEPEPVMAMPRKTLLSAEDNLMADVAPLPPMPALVPVSVSSRKARTGLDTAAKGKAADLPGSLHRRMAELAGTTR